MNKTDNTVKPLILSALNFPEFRVSLVIADLKGR